MIFNNGLSAPTPVSCPSETCPIMNGQAGGVLIISPIEKNAYIHSPQEPCSNSVIQCIQAHNDTLR